MSDDTNVSGHIDVQLYGLIIGDCPKCGARTFVIKEFVEKDIRGKCYKCGHSVELDF